MSFGCSVAPAAPPATSTATSAASATPSSTLRRSAFPRPRSLIRLLLRRTQPTFAYASDVTIRIPAPNRHAGAARAPQRTLPADTTALQRGETLEPNAAAARHKGPGSAGVVGDLDVRA